VLAKNIDRDGENTDSAGRKVIVARKKSTVPGKILIGVVKILICIAKTPLKKSQNANIKMQNLIAGDPER